MPPVLTPTQPGSGPAGNDWPRRCGRLLGAGHRRRRLGLPDDARGPEGIRDRDPHPGRGRPPSHFHRRDTRCWSRVASAAGSNGASTRSAPDRSPRSRSCLPGSRPRGRRRAAGGDRRDRSGSHRRPRRPMTARPADAASPETLRERFARYLRDRRLPITRQRLEVAEAVVRVPDHPSAERIRRELTRRGVRVGTRHGLSHPRPAGGGRPRAGARFR
jgi:hypothetical protein